MNARRRALLPLLLLAASCASTPEARRDAALSAGLASGVLACQTLLANPTIQAEPGMRELCARMLVGCEVKP